MTDSAAGTTASGPGWAPWHELLSWSPFKIDALGLVTLLGAEEIDAAVGRLVSSAYLEYLPFLGAYVIAGDRFTDKAAGWNLYNISQGIHTTDLAAWLTRWMLSQEFSTTRNFVVWKVTPPRTRKAETFLSILIGIACNGFLIAGTILSADWYGFANALAMIISIIVRVYVIGQQRLAVDAMIDKAVSNFGPPKGDSYEARRYDYQHWKQEHKKRHLRNRKAKIHGTAVENHSGGTNSSTPSTIQKQGDPQVEDTPPTRPNAKEYLAMNEFWTGKEIKVLIIQSDSKAVTFQMPNQLLIPPSLFIEGPQILNPKTYYVMRSIGWFAFAVHIVAIGMATLATQLYTVALIVLPTLLLINKTGCDDSEWMATFSSWKKSIFHRKSKNGKTKRLANVNESTKESEFRFVRSCWIGTRLKAEIFEWPESYEFQKQGEGENETWTSGSPNETQERSKKRQDLYAWLALTQDEEESMDKWDLFPHIRNSNFSWWGTYKLKKHALTGKRVAMGPQDPIEVIKKTTTKRSQDNHVTPFYKEGRTDTLNFVKPAGTSQPTAQKPEPRRGSGGPGSSSAFPALSAHVQGEDEEGSKPDTTHVEALAGTEPASAGSTTDKGPPRVNTQTSSEQSSQIDPSTSMTQSPTAMVATDQQP